MNHRVNNFWANFWGLAGGILAALIAAYYQFGPPQNMDSSVPWAMVSFLVIGLIIKQIQEKRDYEARKVAVLVESKGRLDPKGSKLTWLLNEGKSFHRRQLARCRSSPLKLIGWACRAGGISLVFLLFGMLAAWASLRVFAPEIGAEKFKSIVIHCGLWLALLPFAYCVFLVSRTIYVLGEIGGDRRAVFRLLRMVGAVVLFYATVYFFIVSVNPESFKGMRSVDDPGLIEDFFGDYLMNEEYGGENTMPILLDCVYFSVITI